MLKISFAGCLNLFPAISTQFTLKMCGIIQKRKKIIKAFYLGGIQGHSRSSMLTFRKLVVKACYDKQHVCAYVQPFSR